MQCIEFMIAQQLIEKSRLLGNLNKTIYADIYVHYIDAYYAYTHMAYKIPIT